ncbi:serine/threonine-protein kinase/endoribonuclease IRE1a-like isoform X2 [Bidens hawaiensis]|uniref:serine/threonine-protein kinase/endoribonuclease IRE1a-like isoform X2 n=1 Tax=Bidens hawaiensis TaxID=980011 RepID=UPI0040490627
MVGSCRRLAEDETSLRSDATGTPGWRTPEQILDLPQTQAMDVFNLGCVFFFLLTQGKHPFGESSENNVADNNIVNLYLVERIPEAKDLISRLLEFEPQLRPKASEVLRHPLFWDYVKRMSFLRDASVRVNGKMNGDRSIGEVIERGGKVFHGAVNVLFNSETIIIEREQDEPFCFVNAQKLLHLVQIKVVNLRRIAFKKKLQYLPMLEELDHYLRERFPNLLMGVYDVML